MGPRAYAGWIAIWSLVLVGCSGPTAATAVGAESQHRVVHASEPPATTEPIELSSAPSTRAIEVIAPIDEAAQDGAGASSWYPLEYLHGPYGEAVPGVLTFRGSPNRSFYGRGPVPASPSVQWTYPSTKMCRISSDLDGEREWCGTGWTGQPAIWERGDGLWAAYGGYDGQVHVLDAITGIPRMEPFATGDIIKGSLTVDPDGHPLLYVGSRDNYLRVLSFDQGELVELWRLSAYDVPTRKWNDDWDGSPVVIDDHLIVGGENSNLHIVELHRGYDPDGYATVAPELLYAIPGWDQELLSVLDDDNVSIESSVTIVDDVVYFANSGGLVQGWDIGPIRHGDSPVRTFRFWMGDDTDATVITDTDGFLYAASEYERGNDRSRQLGQVVKLDPRRPDNPVVWSIDARTGLESGVWATAAIHRGVVFVPTHDGRLLGIDQMTGQISWTLRLPGPLWSSPVIVDDVLVQADCRGFVNGFDVSDTEREPMLLWSTPVGGCIESTPVVWEGRVWVGTRAGHFHLLGDG